MKKVNSFSVGTTYGPVDEKISSIIIAAPESLYIVHRTHGIQFYGCNSSAVSEDKWHTEMINPPKPYGKTELQSEPFYSCINGYKMKVSFYPRGTKSNKNGYSSIFLGIMKGEYDEALSWPFRHKVVFTLIDQKRDHPEKRSNLSMELIPDPSKHAKSCSKPTQVENPRFGFSRLCCIYSAMGYVQDDSLLLEVRVIKIKVRLYT